VSISSSRGLIRKLVCTKGLVDLLEDGVLQIWLQGGDGSEGLLDFRGRESGEEADCGFDLGFFAHLEDIIYRKGRLEARFLLKDFIQVKKNRIGP
jgi:hypothetical protein